MARPGTPPQGAPRAGRPHGGPPRHVRRRARPGRPGPEIFGIEPNGAVLHQVVTAQLAAARAGTQSTKTRAQVRGGGAKPYRQKGTGRARQGSTRAPQLGRAAAWPSAPSPAATASAPPRRWCAWPCARPCPTGPPASRVALVDPGTGTTPKTKDAVAALAALGLDGRVLVVLGEDDVVAERSFANLPDVQTVAGRRALRLRRAAQRLGGLHRRDPARGVDHREPVVEASTPRPATPSGRRASTPRRSDEVVEPKTGRRADRRRGRRPTRATRSTPADATGETEEADRA